MRRDAKQVAAALNDVLKYRVFDQDTCNAIVEASSLLSAPPRVEPGEDAIEKAAQWMHDNDHGPGWEKVLPADQEDYREDARALFKFVGLSPVASDGEPYEHLRLAVRHRLGCALTECDECTEAEMLVYGDPTMCLSEPTPVSAREEQERYEGDVCGKELSPLGIMYAKVNLGPQSSREFYDAFPLSVPATLLISRSPSTPSGDES